MRQPHRTGLALIHIRIGGDIRIARAQTAGRRLGILLLPRQVVREPDQFGDTEAPLGVLMSDGKGLDAGSSSDVSACVT